MTHTKIDAVQATIVRFKFRKYVRNRETILVKMACESLKSNKNQLNRNLIMTSRFKNYADRAAVVGIRF